MLIQEHVDLRHLNTFHVSAKARYFSEVHSTEELQETLAWAQAQQVTFMLLGQGSNILFKQDYPGLIIEIHIKGISVLEQTAEHIDVKVMGGEIWHEFVLYCLERDFYGLENLSLIPGTVGAAPVQNIGAYGVEIKDRLLELEALSIATGKFRVFSNSQCDFSYRSSVFKQALQGQYIICSVTFRLLRKAQLKLDYPALKQVLGAYPAAVLTPKLVSETVCAIRSSKLPDHHTLGNAGSFFWNPHITQTRYTELQTLWPEMPGYPDIDGIKIPAAWLIEKAGWKGYREGDVGVHKEHALVLVNYGQASGAQLVALSEKIQLSVYERFDIALVPEVRII